jgi:hypothetical protein
MKRVHILLLASSRVYILEERLFSPASLTVDLVRQEHHSSSSTGSREWMATLRGSCLTLPSSHSCRASLLCPGRKTQGVTRQALSVWSVGSAQPEVVLLRRVTPARIPRDILSKDDCDELKVCSHRERVDNRCSRIGLSSHMQACRLGNRALLHPHGLPIECH